jgi:urease accessory protein
MSAFRTTLFVTALSILSGPALAHVGAAGTSGFAAGLGHPLAGVDHVLAMVLVGMLAWQMGGRALFLLPATFVVVTAAAGAAAVAGVAVPFVELGIGLSIIAFGGAVALAVRAPAAMAAATVGIFALFHGAAHGVEMPGTADGLSYGVGFIAATLLLHLAGLATGAGLGRVASQGGLAAMRAVGGISAIAGLGILWGIA